MKEIISINMKHYSISGNYEFVGNCLFLYDLEYTKYKQIVARFDKHELEPHVQRLVEKVPAKITKLNKTI